MVEFGAEALNGTVAIRVRDNGPGLPEGVKNLYENPQLAPQVPTEERGLEVATVCRFFGMATGRIEVLRSDASGTDLRVTLPLEMEPMHAVA